MARTRTQLRGTVSEQTKAALEAAITAHIADECDGDLATAWVVIAETTNLEEIDDNMSAFYIDTRETQSTYTTDGMLYHALNRGTHD